MSLMGHRTALHLLFLNFDIIMKTLGRQNCFDLQHPFCIQLHKLGSRLILISMKLTTLVTFVKFRTFLRIIVFVNHHWNTERAKF
jgi:hypothetical protein